MFYETFNPSGSKEQIGTTISQAGTNAMLNLNLKDIRITNGSNTIGANETKQKKKHSFKFQPFSSVI